MITQVPRRLRAAMLFSLATLVSAGMPIGSATAAAGGTPTDLTAGVSVGTRCVQSEVLLPSGATLDPGCYEFIAQVSQQETDEGALVADAVLEVVSMDTGETRAHIESTGFVIEDDPQNRTEVEIEFSAQLRSAGVFDATPELDRLLGTRTFAVNAKRAASCASLCVKRACGICGPDHKTQWDEEEQICRGNQAAAQCVAGEYSKCWDENCNLAKALFDFGLDVTGLFGIGATGGRIIRFIF